MIKKINEFNQNVKDIIKKADCFESKKVYIISDEDKDTFSYNGYLDTKELIYLGQIALNNHCDLFIFEDNLYLAESHDSDDFKSKNYDEECDYCYSVSLLISNINKKEEKTDDSLIG